MRLSPEDALRLGLIQGGEASKIASTGRRGAPLVSKAVAALNASKLAEIAEAPPAQGARRPSASTPVARSFDQAKASKLGAGGLPSSGSKEYRELATSPQKILFEALRKRLDCDVQWEAEGLIPGRGFKADIFIPPRTVIEMDGFRFHKSKTAFQADRDRQNLFVMHGYRPIRVYAKQVFNAEMLESLLSLIEATVALPQVAFPEQPVG